MGTSKNLLRVADLACGARCTLVQLRFSAKSAAARDGFSRCPYERRRRAVIQADARSDVARIASITLRSSGSEPMGTMRKPT